MDIDSRHDAKRNINDNINNEYQRIQNFLSKNTEIKNLRELFDSLSHEYKHSSIEEKLATLRFLSQSEEDLESIVRYYQLCWNERKYILDELPLTLAALINEFLREKNEKS